MRPEPAHHIARMVAVAAFLAAYVPVYAALVVAGRVRR